MIYAVIDTNVIVSSLLSIFPDSATVLVREAISKKIVTPLYNEEILAEYRTVLSRSKFDFPSGLIESLLEMIVEGGVLTGKTPSNEQFLDKSDTVFYEVCLSREGSYLVTGNKKHFPAKPFVVSPAELINMV